MSMAEEDRGRIASLPLDRAPKDIASMFDAIALRYDLLNRLLSAGMDQRWRVRAVNALGITGRSVVLDLCTGTADLALALARANNDCRVVGVDFAGRMLQCGRSKVRQVSLDDRVMLVKSDATNIPLGDDSVDGVSIGFGIRNVRDPVDALSDAYRVMRPGGRLVILEFAFPSIAAVRAVYMWYFKRLIPLIGKMVSRHRKAYDYLPASVMEFPDPASFCRLLTRVGFDQVRSVPLTLGVVYLYEATKSGGDRLKDSDQQDSLSVGITH